MTRIRSLAVGAATILLAAATTLVLTGSATADPVAKPLPTPANGSSDPGVTPMHCSGHAHSNKDSLSGLLFDGSNVNIRSFPHTSCNPPIALGQLNHQVDYWCFGSGDSVTRNGLTYTTWTFLRDVSSGFQGWVSDAFLDLNPPGNPSGVRGSLAQC